MNQDTPAEPGPLPPLPMEEIAPCPFCKARRAAHLQGRHLTNLVTTYAVRCHNCGACGPSKEIGPLAITAWNKRENAIAARVAQETPLWTNERINICINDVVASQPNHTPRGLARRVLYIVRDDMQAAIAAKDERIRELEVDKAKLQAIGWELQAELADARKPMRVIVQPDFEIDLGTEPEGKGEG